jgi:hypothetical protein
MAPRLELQALLEVICANVYFQGPGSQSMSYPAIVYERDRSATQFANDKPYVVTRQYSLTLITRNPDDDILAALERLPACTHERHFAVDGLNHDVFSIYF